MSTSNTEYWPKESRTKFLVRTVLGTIALSIFAPWTLVNVGGRPLNVWPELEVMWSRPVASTVAILLAFVIGATVQEIPQRKFGAKVWWYHDPMLSVSWLISCSAVVNAVHIVFWGTAPTTAYVSVVWIFVVNASFFLGLFISTRVTRSLGQQEERQREKYQSRPEPAREDSTQETVAQSLTPSPLSRAFLATSQAKQEPKPGKKGRRS